MHTYIKASVIALALVLVFAACNAEETQDENSNEQSTTNNTACVVGSDCTDASENNPLLGSNDTATTGSENPGTKTPSTSETIDNTGTENNGTTDNTDTGTEDSDGTNNNTGSESNTNSTTNTASETEPTVTETIDTTTNTGTDTGTNTGDDDNDGDTTTNTGTTTSTTTTTTEEKPGKCETAFAFGASTFVDLGLTRNRWGWQVGELAPGTYKRDLYAGAGGNDITKGTKVGILVVDYDGETVRVSYELSKGFTASETHLYVGTSSASTISPGQLGNTHEGVNASSDDFVLDGFRGENVFIVAHAVVCGSY